MTEVVAAIIEKKSLILITRRKNGKHLEGFWEFPGGKMEKGETPVQCLKRELQEELSIEIEMKIFIGESIHTYSKQTIKLICFTAEIVRGEIQLQDHDKYEWIRLEDISFYKMAPADLPIIELYKKQLND
jgi:8-oxo-dGTP diphosphatase